MATEHQLSDKVKIIVFYGGRARGRCYDFVTEVDGTKYTRTLTEEALIRVVMKQGELSRG